MERTEKILVVLCKYSEDIKHFSCDPISQIVVVAKL